MTESFEIGSRAPLVAGLNALDNLPAWYRRCRASSFLIVSDGGLKATGWIDTLKAKLAAHARVETFIAPAGEPDSDTVDRGAAAARRLDRPLVVGLGGGSALDIAKLVAALHGNAGPVDNYLLGRKAWVGRSAAVMVPTTSGTGSEVTRTSIVSGADGRKLWAWGEALLPDAVLLDPALTRSLPAAVTASTGLDAFTHALEAATGQSRNRLIEAYALQALRLIHEALPRAVSHPLELESRQRMQEAACLAGTAIDNGGTGMAHNIGHALGSLYHLPHGVAVTLGLRASLAWSIEAGPVRFAAVARALCPRLGCESLPQVLDDLLEQTQFSQALAPFSTLFVDPGALEAEMRAEENRPMADNSARPPQDADWRWLARQTVGSFQALCTTKATA